MLRNAKALTHKVVNIGTASNQTQYGGIHNMVCTDTTHAPTAVPGGGFTTIRMATLAAGAPPGRGVRVQSGITLTPTRGVSVSMASSC
jgi:hypothetical protein